MMQFLTDFADQAVLLPFSVLIALAWALGGWKRGAMLWLAAIAAVLAIMLLLKLSVLGCGYGNRFGLHSPSGHTAGAAAVYGGFAALWLRRFLPAPLAIALGAGLPALLIGATRLELHMHTPPDVLAGAIVGMAGAAAFVLAAGPAPRLRTNAWHLAWLALPLLLLLHGHQARAEPRIQWLAHHLWPFSTCTR